MAKIPFDVKYRPQIESGEYKVETRDGRPARIVCWDAKILGPQRRNKPILALSWYKANIAEEDFSCHLPNGQVLINNPSPRDLLIVTPEPDLTQFEKAVRDCIKNNLINVSEFGVFETFIDDHTAKEISAKLLDIARVELIDEQTRREDLSFSRGLRQGREETKKSPWIPASNPPDSDREVITCYKDSNGAREIREAFYRNYIWIETVEARYKEIYPDYWMEIPKLPKEELK